jgi:hypothetical protein
MKDYVSLLLTTTCLAVAGLGIYFFSYKTDHDNDATQKNNRKRSGGGTNKKIVELEKTNHDDNDNDIDNTDNSTIDTNDTNDIDHYKNVKPKATKSASKTKRNKNKFASSKKRYY